MQHFSFCASSLQQFWDGLNSVSKTNMLKQLNFNSKELFLFPSPVWHVKPLQTFQKSTSRPITNNYLLNK
jgi:hypothetical protein